MISQRASILLVSISLLLAGCGEVAFKRGGKSDELAAARRQCRQATTEDAAYRDCLGRAGWSVADLAEPEPSGAGTPAPPPASVATPASAAAPASVGAPILAPVQVKSWWRVGAGSGDLAGSVKLCQSQIGIEPGPLSDDHTVSGALYRCLADQGWHASH